MNKELYEHICEEKVFEQVYSKYAKDVHDFLYYKYGNQHNPDDTMQDAFVKLWENCAKTSFQRAKSYVFTIANNLMLNKIKHKKVVLAYQKEPVRDRTNETPEFLLEEEQFFQQYQNALSKLNEEQRVAFSLSKIEGKKYKEIAEILNVTEKVVEYRIVSAFKQLKQELESFRIK